jgi:hypothetical protein
MDQAYDYRYITNLRNRDVSSWLNIVLISDTTASTSSDRIKIYINGSLVTDFGTRTDPSINFLSYVSNVNIHSIGANNAGGSPAAYYNGYISDIFFIDGQALTPDVFGFYKEGKGYISAGSTQATDFRPGQWVPKTPRVIKAQIERNGGFGVNGFYLPMNDSSNFGADFHCEPNSIITLKGEDLPQPRNGAPETTDAYVSQLRTDPYAANLVLAVPGIIGAPGVAYTDFSANIKGSGTNKVITANGAAGVAVTASYYGSAMEFTGVAGTYFSIPNSADLRFGSEDFTIEAWCNIDNVSGEKMIISLFNTSSQKSYRVGFSTSDTISVLSADGSANDTVNGAVGIISSNQWNHLAFVKEGPVMTHYVNGVAVGIKTNSIATLHDNTGDNIEIGQFTGGSSVFDGYMQDLRVYKGVAKYTGGFDVPKPYTPVGIATWRAVPDTTANNFATLNPLDRARLTGTQTDGNLSTGNNSGNYTIRSTVGVSTGKWYWEFCTTAVTNINHHGIVATGRSMGGNYIGQTPDSWGMYEGNGNKRNNASYDSYGSGFSQYDVGMVALDRTNGKIWWGKNGTWFASGNPSSGTNEAFSNINSVCGVGSTDAFVSPAQLQYTSCSYNFGQNPTFSGNTTAGTYTDSNSKGLFKYEPPSGFLALCEDNLPTPAIANPGRHFKTVLYTGDGNSGRSIVGVGFTPDLIWGKSRTNTAFPFIIDSIRGPGNRLFTNDTQGDNLNITSISSFNSDGFSMGSLGTNNASSQNYVAWCWRAGAGTTSTNTDGSITSVVSVNQTAGFSIVSYRASNGSSIGHGLGKQPAFMIIKNRDATGDWFVYHKNGNAGSDMTSAQGLNLNNTGATFTSGSNTFITAKNSSTFTVGTSGLVQNGTDDLIAYIWAEIEGFSKFGSYVGNGNADGSFVYCGFKPAVVIIKQTDGTGDWYIFDSSRNSSNPVSLGLISNTTQIDGDYTGWGDFLSNGFKIRRTDSAWNGSGNSYIFAAFAESPFQTANAK